MVLVKKTAKKVEKPDEIRFKFTGTNEIEINTLIESLQSSSKALQQYSYSNSSNSDIKIVVKPFKEGSFEWIIGILCFAENVQTVIDIEDGLPGKGIIKKFKSGIELVKFFKGEKPKEVKQIDGDNWEIKNNSGDVKIINGDEKNNFFQNRGAVVHIEQLIVNVANDKSINAFELFSGKQKIQISQQEIQNIAVGISKRLMDIKEENQDYYEDKKQVNVVVTKPDLLNDTKWGIIYDGSKINATVKDNKFIENVRDRNFAFTNGTVLKVDLSIKKVFNNDFKTYENKDWIITNVRDVMNPGTQTKLF